MLTVCQFRKTDHSYSWVNAKLHVTTKSYLPIEFCKFVTRTGQFSKLTQLISFTVNQIEGLNDGLAEN